MPNFAAPVLGRTFQLFTPLQSTGQKHWHYSSTSSIRHLIESSWLKNQLDRAQSENLIPIIPSYFISDVGLFFPSTLPSFAVLAWTCGLSCPSCRCRIVWWSCCVTRGQWRREELWTRPCSCVPRHKTSWKSLILQTERYQGIEWLSRDSQVLQPHCCSFLLNLFSAK